MVLRRKRGHRRQADAPRPVRTMQAGISSLADVNYLPGEVRPRYEQRYGFRVPENCARRLVDVVRKSRPDKC